MYGYLYFAQTELQSTLDQNTQSRISKKCYTIAIVENNPTKLKREYRKLRDGLRGHDGANRQHREFKDDLCKKGPGWNDPMAAVVPRVKGFACYDLSFSRHNKNIKMEHFFLYILSRYFIWLHKMKGVLMISVHH